MPAKSTVADLPVLPIRVGLALGSTALGVVAVVLFVVASSKPFATLVGALVFAVLFGVLTWLLGRRATANHRNNLSRVPPPTAHNSSRALRRGLLYALAVTTAEVLALGPLAWLWGTESVATVGAGTLLGLGLSVTLDARDLSRWQDANSVAMFTRAGARIFAFTGSQVRQQTVLVANRDEVTAAARSQI